MVQPITLLKRWEREADALPEPTTDGVWIRSPRGVSFVTKLHYDTKKARWIIGWDLCNARLEPLGLTFRQTEVMP